MSSVKTYKSKIVVIVLLVLLGSVLWGCSRKQYTQQHSSIVIDSNRLNKIDTYLFQGIKHYVYDTTIVTLNTAGDTVRTDHRSDSRYYQEEQQKQDTVYIEKVSVDTVYMNQGVIVKNELNKTQKFFVWWGVAVMVAIVGWFLFKLFNLFRK